MHPFAGRDNGATSVCLQKPLVLSLHSGHCVLENDTVEELGGRIRLDLFAIVHYSNRLLAQNFLPIISGFLLPALQIF